MNALQGRRLLVIGASSGMGRASAIAFATHGADVVFAARRTDALTAAVEEAGSGHVVSIDVLDQADIARGVEESAELLGGFDGILYTAGASSLRPMRELTLEDWQHVFGINTFGPSLVITAALPYLSDDAIVGVVSSDSSQQPRHSLVAYGAAKRALEATFEGWRTEVLGGTRFLTIVLGPTQPTEFLNASDIERMGEVIPHWQRQGFNTALMNADDVGQGLTAMYTSMFAAPMFGIESVLLRAPEPEMPNTDFGA